MSKFIEGSRKKDNFTIFTNFIKNKLIREKLEIQRQKQ